MLLEGSLAVAGVGFEGKHLLPTVLDKLRYFIRIEYSVDCAAGSALHKEPNRRGQEI